MSTSQDTAPHIAKGTRLSFDGALCTVRYIGPVDGTSGQWLGVEWDDPTRGKHSGEHNGVKYFECKSKQPTAGSFVRPGRASDKPLSFLEAAHDKYVSELEMMQQASAHATIEISGKIVEEVGFEKIRRLLAQLHELRIVLLDGMRMKGVLADQNASAAERQLELQRIREICPKITELDMSRNLLQGWKEVTDICLQLGELRVLKLNGNRFEDIDETRLLTGVSQLSLDETLLNWDEIVTISNLLPSLTKLSLASNRLVETTSPLPSTIRELNLNFNQFESFSCLRPLTLMPNLTTLSLRGNKLCRPYQTGTDGQTTEPDLVFSSSLTSLDISKNNIDSWSFIDALPHIFPGLSTLRVSTNPLYDKPPAPSTVTNLPEKPMTADEAFMLTLARLAQLKVLNYSTINSQDRVNGELYYLALIRTELALYPPGAEKRILSAHPRYRELCQTYDVPDLKRKAGSGEDSTDNPRSLGVQLVKFNFYWPSAANSDTSSGTSAKEFAKEIPRSFDVYRVKALVARQFSLPPLRFKLIWETDEWDPVEQGTAEEDEWDSEEECDSLTAKDPTRAADKRLVRREEELMDSTKEIGMWLDAGIRLVRVRVEPFP